MQRSQQMHLLSLDWLILTTSCPSWLLVGLAITIFFVVKGLKVGLSLSILATTVLGILIHVVDITKIDFCK